MEPRGEVPSRLKLHYQRRWYWYEDRKGNPICAKPLFQHHPEAELVDTGRRGPEPTVRVGRPPKPRDGMGVLSVTVDSAKTMPVLAVDGRPVAVGRGEMHLLLDEGRHLVEVQNIDTISPVVAEIFAGQTTALVWRESDSPGERAFGFQLDDIGPVKTGLPAYHMLLGMLLVCGLPFGAVASTQTASLSARVTLLIIAAAALGALLAYPWSRREKRRYRAAVIERRSIQSVDHQPHPWGDLPNWSNPILVGEDPVGLPELSPGGSALLLELKAHRHLWKSGVGIVDRDAEIAALWARPPRVLIDGVERYATWGNWWYPLRPGPHRIRVEAPGWDHPDATAADAELVIESEVGKVSIVAADAHLRASRGTAGPIELGPVTLTLNEQKPGRWEDRLPE
jgi:hypothetical protein